MDHLSKEQRAHQAANRINNVNVTYQGETLNLKQWSRKLGIGYTTIYQRYKRGKTLEVVFAPVQPRVPG